MAYTNRDGQTVQVGLTVGVRCYSHDDLQDYSVHVLNPETGAVELAPQDYSGQDRPPANLVIDAPETNEVLGFRNGWLMHEDAEFLYVEQTPEYVSDAYWNVVAGLGRTRVHALPKSYAPNVVKMFGIPSDARRMAYHAEQVVEALKDAEAVLYSEEVAKRETIAAYWTPKHGDEVVVYKGRKVAKGTAGFVFWVGSDNFGKARLGIKDADGVTHWTAADNCQVI